MLAYISIILTGVLLFLLLKRVYPEAKDRARLINLIIFVGLGLVLVLFLVRIGAPLLALLSSAAVIVATIFDKIIKFSSLYHLFISLLGKSNSDRANYKRSSDKMSRQEALDILGLSGNPTKEEIHQAYINIMKNVHPDRGGSRYLAQQINRARDKLLKQ